MIDWFWELYDYLFFELLFLMTEKARSPSRPNSAERVSGKPLPQLPLSARSPQRFVTPPLKSSRELRAEALEQLSCSSVSYENNFVNDTNVSTDRQSFIRNLQAGIKLPPLTIPVPRSTRSHGDLSALDDSSKNHFEYYPVRNAYTPTPKTPNMWGDSYTKSPSPPLLIETKVSPSSRQESFNVPQHRLAAFDQLKGLRRPRSPADGISTPTSTRMLLKASLTPKAANGSFFGDTVDAETVEIQISPSISSDETISENFPFVPHDISDIPDWRLSASSEPYSR